MTFARKYLNRGVEDSSIQEISDHLFRRIEDLRKALADVKSSAEPASDQKPIAPVEPLKPAPEKPIGPPEDKPSEPPAEPPQTPPPASPRS